MEKWPNAKSVIKLKASITIQVRVTGGGYSWASCNPYIQLVALKQTARRSRCPNSYVHLGRESKTHPSTKVCDSMHHGSNQCMVVYAWRRLSVMKGRTIKVVRARGLSREVVLLAHHKKMNMSSYEEGSCRLVSI